MVFNQNNSLGEKKKKKKNTSKLFANKQFRKNKQKNPQHFKLE